MTYIRRSLVVAALVPVMASCSDSGVDAPFTLEQAGVAISLEFAAGATAGGPRTAYLKSDRLELQFTDAGSTRAERLIDFAPADTATHVPVYVTLRQATEELDLGVEIRVGPDAVFRGTTTVELKAGRTTSTTVVLVPVVAGIVGPDGLPVLTAYGDMLSLSAAAVFATGDTISPSVASWAGLDPGIATVDEGGTVTARSDGTARVVARFEQFADTVSVVVRAQVASVTVSPVGQSIPVGSTLQYTATPRDARGNPVPGRTVTWSSTDPSILTVDQNGLARAVGVGNARVIAVVSSSEGDATASTIPGPPLTEDLTVTLTQPLTATFSAAVIPNGGSTDTWFEWAPVSTSAQTSLTIKRNVGAGLVRVPVGTTVPSLLPATSYTVRVVATNLAGRHESETVFFTTGAIVPSVKTLPVTGPTPPNVTLNGTASANGSSTTVWFEWASDSTAATVKTPTQTIQGFASMPISAIVPSGSAGTTWYYRIAANNEAGTSYGGFLSWTVLTPPPPGPPLVAALPASTSGVTAVLNGEVNPVGWPTMAWFEWGTDPSLATYTTIPSQSVGSGTAVVPYKTFLSGLVPGNTYYFRAVAENTWGFTRSGIVPFIGPPDPNVPPPAAATLPPTAIGGGSITLNGTANPNGFVADAWFEYGTDPALSVFTSTAMQSVGSGTSDVPFSETVTSQPITNVRYYRAVARNAGGITRGAIVMVQY